MNMKQPSVLDIRTPYIQLGQLLKLVGVIGHGGEAKVYLATNTILVNGEAEARRGRKIYPGSFVEVGGVIYTLQAI
jgi:ribosome-associated protein YbcJ (S4-like RNA binding protein)